MRILHVSQPVEAGVPNVVTALLADELNRNDEVHVACPPGAGLADRVASLGGVHHAWQASRFPGRTVPGEVRRLRRIIDQVDPDVVILHSAKAGLAGRLAQIRHRRPTVYVPHAWSFEAVDGSVAAVSKWWEVVAGRWTDVVVCVSDDERQRGLQSGVSCPIEVIPNGVDVETRVPQPTDVARTQLGMPDSPTVVCVGRLAPQKGQDLLLELWPTVLSSVPNARLILVGDGPMRPDLQRIAPPSVSFAGTQEDVDTYLAAADVVVLPSRWESTPLVSLETMAAGRTLVAFEVDGIGSAAGDTGIILRQGDLAGMAQALVTLLGDPVACAAAGRAARERVLSVGDIRTGLKAWNDLLVNQANRGPKLSRPLQVLPVDKVLRSVAGGALRHADVVALAGASRATGFRASALSAMGVPVWWQGGQRGSAIALAAPILTGAVAGDDLARIARRPGADSVGGPPVSAVVTVLNEGSELRPLVEKLLLQSSPDDEIIIVDGGSTDGSVATLPVHPQLRVEIVPGAGISAGRNHGVRVARHDVIVCTDAGCDPDPGFIDGFRRAFSGSEPPALVSGVYSVQSTNALERAQALACYPQPREVRRPDVAVRTYSRIFGTGFDPRFAVGRCVAFTRAAWDQVDGFPEHLATGEDVSFGLAVARTGDCLASVDAAVSWKQRDGMAATWRMYRGYGRASTSGGGAALAARDGARLVAYLLAPVLLSNKAGRMLTAIGAGAYLSLPVTRAVRARTGPLTVLLLPVALTVKDVGKIVGALEGLLRRQRRHR